MNQCVCVIYNVGLPSIANAIRAQFTDPAGSIETIVQETASKPAMFKNLVQSVDPEFKASARTDVPDPIQVVCSGMLNPDYVTVSNVRDIADKSGFVLKVYAASNWGARSRRGPSEVKQLLGVCTVYMKDAYLYIATICALSVPNTLKGIAGRAIHATKDISRIVPGCAGVKLDALLYCRNPNMGNGEIFADTCLSWLHDYYIDQGFRLMDGHVRDPTGDAILEYAPDAVTGKQKKVRMVHKNLKFNTEHTVPMVWTPQPPTTTTAP